VAYAIGVAEPVSLCIHTFGTETVDERSLHEMVGEICSPLLTPRSIIERLDLRRPIYRQTAAFGHFGRDDLGAAWEQPAAELRPDLLAAKRDVA
jgi:S-adenosylmethionine synthetase